jgi:hypothetical protein
VLKQLCVEMPKKAHISRRKAQGTVILNKLKSAPIHSGSCANLHGLSARRSRKDELRAEMEAIILREAKDDYNRMKVRKTINIF